MKLKDGDIVISGSDGIFDNISDAEIASLVASQSNKTPSNLARFLTDASRQISLDENAKTPYALEAKKNKVKEYSNGLGGKVDDVCCVALVVGE